MFIRETKSKNKGYSQIFSYHHLVKSVRTEAGPRQEFILNLGTLDLPKKDWPLLANRIEEIINGQHTFYVASPKIEQLAQFYARKIIQKESKSFEDNADYQEVDVNHTSVSEVRTIGPEYICYSYLKHLKLDEYLDSIYFSKRQIEVAFLLIIGRLVKPGSELKTYGWAKNKSALDELLETDFAHLSKNTLYDVSDKLYEHRKGIEEYLAAQERDLYNLSETIILYDLTNSYFEGRADGIDKASYGRSKERRNDCKLLTLGLIIDKDGYPKASKILPGNQGDPASLREMIEDLRKLSSQRDDIPSENGKITVVIDAGIATEDNLAMLKAKDDEQTKSIHYIVASRRKVDQYFNDDGVLIAVRDGKKNKVEVKLLKPEEEEDIFLYCHSEAKEKRDKSIRNSFELLFEQEINNIEASLHKKHGTKKYDKVCERVGRLRERYPTVSTYYRIDVIRDRKKKRDYAVKLDWEYIKKQEANDRFSGRYYLRTDRTDLNEEEIFDIYTMLTRLEEAFRYLKTDLGLRPNYHQKGFRAEGHIFIAVLAYHVLNSIQNRLHLCEYHSSWENIIETLSSHVRVTEELPKKDGDLVHIRQCSEPEFGHESIYELLQLSEEPLEPRKR